MKNTIYASFNDPKLARKAAGALLHHGLRPEDLSIVARDRCEPEGELFDSSGTTRNVSTSYVPQVGFVIGTGALASAIVSLAESRIASTAMTSYLKDQGVESEIVAAYDDAVCKGGAVLGATLSSGLDECHAWEILNKYAGLHVTSYLNRPYVH